MKIFVEVCTTVEVITRQCVEYMCDVRRFAIESVQNGNILLRLDDLLIHLWCQLKVLAASLRFFFDGPA